ncbi:unnamed protein product [Diamesa serratosioi]
MLKVCSAPRGALCYMDFAIAFASTLVILVNCLCGLFLMTKIPLSDIKTLLRLHNLRAVILILICLTSVCEIGSTYLLVAHTNDNIMLKGLMPYVRESACFFFISIITSTILLRVIEVRKGKSEIIQCILKSWKWIYLQNFLDIMSMNLLIQTLTTVLLLILTIVDASTIYLENLTSITSKSCDPTLLSKENISYKNPYSTFLSKMTFWWISSLIWNGFWRPLELNDLGNLAENNTCRYHYDQFLFIYQSFKNKQVSLWTCYRKSCWKMLIFGGMLKLFGDLCGLVGPLSISYIVDFINLQLSNETISNVSDLMIAGAGSAMEMKNFNENDYVTMINYPNWSEFIANGWIMAFIVLIAFLLQGTFSQASTNLVNMEGIKIKNALQGLIYRKTLSLSGSCFYKSNATNLKGTSAAEKSNSNDNGKITDNNDDNNNNNTVGDDDDDDMNDVGKITNLMSDDSLNIMSFFWIIHYVWSIPLKIIIIIYCLYLKLGVSSLIGSIVCILFMIPLQFAVGKMMSSNSKDGAKCADERLKKIREVFFRIKLIKLNAWEQIYVDKIGNCREKELHYLNIDAVYMSLMTFLTHISSILITIVTFAVYTLINDDKIEFNASNVFAALALFNQLTVPLFIFPITIPMIISAIISTKRIERFLSQIEISKEFEGIRNMARVLCKSNTSLDEEPSTTPPSTSNPYEDSYNNNQIKKRNLGRTSVVGKNTSNINNNQVITNESLKIKLPSFIISDDFIVSIKDAKYSWDNRLDDSNMLKIDQLSIPRGVLTIIVGKTASGKSSLLGALLKEMQIVSGSIEWNKYSTISYVSQVPFCLNASIRDNILFGEPYRPKRYDKIIESCALKADIDLMPNGDLTEIGERGLSISGGQRQRLCIARALYSSANVIILDDALSSLDNHVASSLFEKSIKRVSMKHKRTILLVSQKTQLVYAADFLIAMDNQTVRVSGTMKEIKEKEPSLIKEWDTAIAKESSKDNQLSPLSGRTAKERWKLFKNISRIGLQRSLIEEDTISSNNSLFVPFKRTSSNFGSRLWSELPLPIDECHDTDYDFNHLPELRKKKDAERILRVNSLQVNVINRMKPPLARHISSPMRFNYEAKPPSTNRLSDTSFSSFGSKMSFRKILRRMSSKSRPTMEKTELFQDEEAENRLKSDEERKYGKIPSEIYLLYLKACNSWVLAVFFITTLLYQALRVYTDVWLRNWTDNNNETLQYYFNVYAMLSVLCIILAIIATPFGQLAGANARKHLHEQLVGSVMKNSLHFFQSTPFGRIMNRFSFDMSIIDKKIATTSQRLLQFILLCSCAVLINTVINKWFILLTIPIFAIYYGVQKFYRASSRELQRIESITSSPIISHFSETILGLTTIRAYNQESRFMEMLFKHMEANNVAFIILNSSNRWLGIALDYLGAFIVFAAIATALCSVHLLPDNGSSIVGLAINYTLLIPIYLNWVVKLFADMEMYFGACERISFYIDSCYHENNNNKIKMYETVPISWPQYGKIVFENVSLKYENQEENIISNLNLCIPTGQRIGICGRSGSGKSTLSLSLFGVVDITSGRILIDDVDIATVRLDELRSRLSIIPQEDSILFCSTIRDNLDPRGHFSDLELWNSLEVAQLKELVQILPNKLDTYFGEGDALFSQGQRQLFCLARAVLRGSICLVLDEATSNLDSATEKKLLKAATEAFKGRTVITIAHRLYSLLDYDRVVIMENGKIIEDGNPKELKANPNSTYRHSMLANSKKSQLNHESQSVDEKNERSESGFSEDISFEISSSSKGTPFVHIPLSPPNRVPPSVPIVAITEFTPPRSPSPVRKMMSIPEITILHASPSPTPKEAFDEEDGSFNSNNSMNIIENNNENEIKIHELNDPIASESSTTTNVRKEGIISDKINHHETKDFEYKVFPKEKAAREMIKAAIMANDFMNSILDKETIRMVVDAMSMESFNENEFIINEGDKGSHLFISADGIFQVIKGGSVIKSFGPGVVFGELAILYKAMRFASIKVLTRSKVWMLERKVFQKIMMSSGRREREENIKFLSSVSVLKDLPLEVLNKISDLLKREFYPSGSTIIRQGDVGDKFYIIRGGSVNVIKKDNENGVERLVGVLKRGAYFGEQALLRPQDKRLASITANASGVEVLALDQISFDSHLGSLEMIKNSKIEDQTFPKLSKNQTTQYGHVQLCDLKVIGTLGVGGFGRVELVQYQNEATFALKYLKKIEMVQQQQQEHAYNEKEILYACDSSFIVRLYKTYRDNKYLYFLMEPCLGGDVWSILQQHKHFDEQTAQFMAACVIVALEYLHSKHFIYRDLKPENLLLDSHGYIKLVDFGFAKHVRPTHKTWTFAGTPEYVAPEIILNKGHDNSVDFWSLGILIHEFLMGKPPFRGKDQMQTYNLILRGIDCVQLSQKIPKKAQMIIKRLCRQSANERLGYQKNGIKDIKNHSWYADFDWDKLQNHKMQAPLVRHVKDNTDLSNFDEYPRDRDDPPDELSGWDKEF